MDHDETEGDLNGTQANGGAADASWEQQEIEELRRRIEALQADADKRVRELVQERPFVALGAALAIGFVFGRLMRRR